MSMQDPISDMLTRIRNAQKSRHYQVTMPSSKLKLAICAVLKEEGYIVDYRTEHPEGDSKPILTLALKYYLGKPVIVRIQRSSKSGLRQYRGKNALPKIDGGLGVAVVSTSLGVMTATAAKKAGVGGEILCYVA